uniref:Secreted protein n=1 Tax=Colobus angolensis palliatus TaxID=336983 RepID=A0A2K5JWI5_COLAP
MIFVLIAAFRLLLGGIVSVRTPQHRGNSTQCFIPKKCMFEELSEIGTKHHVNQLCKIFQPRYYYYIQMDCLILSKDLVILKLGFAVPNHQHSSILPGWCKVIQDVNQKCQ